MATGANHSEYSVLEEILHSITHGVGALLSILGLTWMLYLSIGAGDPWRIVASLIYGASLITLFVASTVYHSMYLQAAGPLRDLLAHRWYLHAFSAGRYANQRRLVVVWHGLGAGNGGNHKEALVSSPLPQSCSR
jgi:channel protein (hemolysin III family)